jgi:hypothetical protein
MQMQMQMQAQVQARAPVPVSWSRVQPAFRKPQAPAASI